MLHLFSLLIVLLGQVNPPGSNVLPSQAAFYSAQGATAQVEVRNYLGQVVPLVDSSGAKFSHCLVTFPPGTAIGLGYAITQTSPAGYPLVALGASQSSVCVTMVSGSATESPVGTFDSSSGAGSGIATGFPAPDANTPTLFATGLTYTIGPGAVIATQSANGRLPVGRSTAMLAASQSGVSGVTLSGPHTISRIVADNASSTTLYLQVFDATSLPANGSTPIAEVTVGFGVSTAPTENEEAFTPDWLSTVNGVFYAWSTTPGVLTLAPSGAGLLVRIYGN
jgi:hypothetical protein